jgi:trans-feruloyl-CoA hydratase/vanillin synthase
MHVFPKQGIIKNNRRGDGNIMTSEDKDLVKVEYDNGVAWVSFNRPEKRNAMTPKLAGRMLEVLDEVEVREDVGVMVLTGE